MKTLAVFGSVARDDARADSDVDFVVEFEGAVTFDRYMALKTFLEGAVGRPVDLLTRRGIRPELAPSIEQEAVYVT
ncbi:MAG: nucleotidyltransferase family protein [Candidatus Omnitrophota bacterium]|nr:nucleotidyltransferase family protein [Candidatus Omnitrophota bacterium]